VVTPIKPHVEPHRARNYKGRWNPFPEIIENRGRRLESTLRNVAKKNKFYNHIPGITVKKRISTKVWSTYFKFCVERNPFDKTISHYHMVNDRAGGGITFDEYIAKESFCINYPKYIDSKSVILVDKVIKYESLMEELLHVFDKLGIPFEGTLGVRAKSESRKDRRPYQKVFTCDQREVIEKAFAKEIEIHGYAF